MTIIRIDREELITEIQRILIERNMARDERDKLAKKVDELEGKIEDLEWENKGIDEWRDVAIKSMQKVKELTAEVERLQAAHDHQYNMAGLMLREAERAGRERDKAANILYDVWPYINVSTNAPQQLLDRMNEILVDIEDERKNS